MDITSKNNSTSISWIMSYRPTYTDLLIWMPYFSKAWGIAQIIYSNNGYYSPNQWLLNWNQFMNTKFWAVCKRKIIFILRLNLQYVYCQMIPFYIFKVLFICLWQILSQKSKATVNSSVSMKPNADRFYMQCKYNKIQQMHDLIHIIAALRPRECRICVSIDLCHFRSQSKILLRVWSWKQRFDT